MPAYWTASDETTVIPLVKPRPWPIELLDAARAVLEPESLEQDIAARIRLRKAVRRADAEKLTT